MGQSLTVLENQILCNIQDVEIRIKELQSEKSALQRLLLQARRNASALKEVSRRNSIDRILVESKILEVLRSAKKPVTSRQLCSNVQAVIGNLKESTFRSHVHRMKLRGLIKYAGARSRNWVIAAEPPISST